MKPGDLVVISNTSELIRVESYPGAFFLEDRPATKGLVKYHPSRLIGIFLSERSTNVPVTSDYDFTDAPTRLYYEFGFPFGIGWVDSSLLWFEIVSPVRR